MTEKFFGWVYKMKGNHTNIRVKVVFINDEVLLVLLILGRNGTLVSDEPPYLSVRFLLVVTLNCS